MFNNSVNSFGSGSLKLHCQIKIELDQILLIVIYYAEQIVL